MAQREIISGPNSKEDEQFESWGTSGCIHRHVSIVTPVTSYNNSDLCSSMPFHSEYVTSAIQASPRLPFDQHELRQFVKLNESSYRYLKNWLDELEAFLQFGSV